MLFWVCLVIVIGQAAFAVITLRHYMALPGVPTVPRRLGMPRVSIIIPARNQAANLGRLLPSLLNLDYGSYEIIVVDDASTDATPGIADELAAADPHVLVVHHPVNRKLGGSIKTGLAAATGDVVLYTDADLPFDMAELGRAFRLLRTYEADIISAYRLDRTTEGVRRTVYSFVYNGLVSAAFGVRLRDINFAFKLIRRRVLDHVEVKSEGSFIDAEFMIRASRMGFQIMQIGVDYFPRTRGESTLSSPAVIATMIGEMRKLRTELKSVRPLAGPPA